MPLTAIPRKTSGVNRVSSGIDAAVDGFLAAAGLAWLLADDGKALRAPHFFESRNGGFSKKQANIWAPTDPPRPTKPGCHP